MAYKYTKKLSTSVRTTGKAWKLETHKNLLHLLTLSVSMEALDLRHLFSHLLCFFFLLKYPWAKLNERRRKIDREYENTTLHSFGSESKYRFSPSIRVKLWPTARLYRFTLQSTRMGWISVITQFITVVFQSGGKLDKSKDRWDNLNRTVYACPAG